MLWVNSNYFCSESSLDRPRRGANPARITAAVLAKHDSPQFRSFLAHLGKGPALPGCIAATGTPPAIPSNSAISLHKQAVKLAKQGRDASMASLHGQGKNAAWLDCSTQQSSFESE